MKPGIFLFLVLLLLSGCSKTEKFNIPDTGINFTIPKNWVFTDNNELLNALADNLENAFIAREYMAAMLVARDNDFTSTYLFQKTADETDISTTTTVMITTIYMFEQALLLDDVYLAQLTGLQNVEHITAVEPDTCPAISIPAFRCFMTQSFFNNIQLIEYQYILMDSGNLVQFTLSSMNASDTPDLEEIIASVTRQDR